MSLAFKVGQPQVRQATSLTPRQRAEIHLKAARVAVGNCTRCPLHRTRKHLLYGAGSPSAPVMVVQERPSYYEDKEGVPAVGEGGAVFATALQQIGLIAAQDIYMTYVVKCAPGKKHDDNNRWVTAKVPEDTYGKCGAFLRRQITIVKPAVLVLQGAAPNKILLGDKRSMNQYSGHFRQYGDKCVALSTLNPYGLFGEREDLVPVYQAHWIQVAFRLDGLGRLWRPDAALFERGWKFTV